MRFILSAIVGVLFLLSACDTALEPDVERNAPPEVSQLAFSPDTVTAVSGDSSSVELEMQVTATDAEQDLDRVRYSLLPPARNADPVAEGALTRHGGDLFREVTTVRLASGAIGRYTLLIYAVDAAGQISNQLRGGIVLTGEGEPPVIEEVIAPEEVNPPTELQFIAVVSDPDGLENIAQVIVLTPNGQRVSLLDDGQSSGDEFADDGRYTATFDVPEGITPGTQTFFFQAFDRFGLESEVVAVDVTVVE